MKVAVLTSGGDCAGLNAAVRALVLAAEQLKLGEVWGIKDGVYGIAEGLESSLFPLNAKFWHSENFLLERGGSFLGSFVRNPGILTKQSWDQKCEEVLQSLKKYSFDALVIIGGDVTLRVARSLSTLGFPVIGVPKTIDDDVCGTRSVGFSTALQRGVDALECLKTTAYSHNRIMVAEIMGRDAGILPLHVAVASGADVALIPEVPYSPEELVEFVNEKSKACRGLLLVTSESAARITGQPSKNAADEVCSILQGHTVQEIRSVVLGHVQRGGSPTARDRLLATVLGRYAARMLERSEFGHFAAWTQGRCVATPLQSLKTASLDLKGDLVKTAIDLGIFLGRYDIKPE